MNGRPKSRDAERTLDVAFWVFGAVPRPAGVDHIEPFRDVAAYGGLYAKLPFAIACDCVGPFQTPSAHPLGCAVARTLSLLRQPIELVINANKYAYGGGTWPITITLEQYRNRFRPVVADHGLGKAGSGKGLSSRMLGSMVKRLSGTMEEAGNDPGLRVTIMAPIAEDIPSH